MHTILLCEPVMLSCQDFFGWLVLTVYCLYLQYNATRFYFTVLVALVSGTIYWKLGKNTCVSILCPLHECHPIACVALCTFCVYLSES